MRKPKKPVLYSGKAVMFEMENGWFYLVGWGPGVKSIAAYGHPMFYTRFDPYCTAVTEEAEVPSETLKKAKELLQKLPVEAALGEFIEYEPFDEHKNPYPELLD